MPIFNVYNSKHERLGSYAAPNTNAALNRAERDCVEGGSRWIGGYAKDAAADDQPPRPERKG